MTTEADRMIEPSPVVEELFQDWLARHPRRYESGEEVRVGDMVDFGFDGQFSNGPSIDLMGEPWIGEIVALEGLDVIVDTHLNAVRRYPIDALDFLGRAKPA